MASIGLRIAQDPYASQGMSLANTLARAIAPDPSKMMQMELMRERAQAQQLYQDQLRANMELAQKKAVRDENLANSLVSERSATEAMNRQKTDEATAGQNARTAASGPLADVFKSRVPKPPLVLAPDILEPQLKQYETTTAAIDAMVPAIIQSGGNADQVGKAIQGIIATPEILYGKPDAVRRGATLQGNLPAETSVLAAGDDIGTTEKIAAEKAKPQTPHFADNGNIVNVPDPSQPSGFRQERVGGAPPVATGPFSGSTVEAQALNILNSIGPKIAEGTATVEEQRAYALADRQVNRPQNYEGVQNGNKVVTPVVNRPVGFPAPAMGGAPDAAAPTPTVIGENPRATTGEQARAVQNLELMDVAEKSLSQMNPTKLYGIVDIIANNPKRELDAREVLGMITDPEARRLFNTFLMFGEGRLRGASGAAISANEWAQEFARFMPPPNAGPEDIDQARMFRAAAIRGQENVAYMGDNTRKYAHRRALKANGIDLSLGEMVDPGPNWTPPPAAAAPPETKKNWVVMPDGSVELR